jgi:hypothetical protein
MGEMGEFLDHVRGFPGQFEVVLFASFQHLSIDVVNAAHPGVTIVSCGPMAIEGPDWQSFGFASKDEDDACRGRTDLLVLSRDIIRSKLTAFISRVAQPAKEFTLLVESGLRAPLCDCVRAALAAHGLARSSLLGLRALRGDNVITYPDGAGPVLRRAAARVAELLAPLGPVVVGRELVAGVCAECHSVKDVTMKRACDVANRKTHGEGRRYEVETEVARDFETPGYDDYVFVIPSDAGQIRVGHREAMVGLDLGESRLGVLPSGCFCGCRRLALAVFPCELREIGTECFRGCDSLRFAEIPRVQMIGASAFRDCSALERVVVSRHLQAIGALAFRGTALLEFDANECCELAVGKDAFLCCRNLRRLRIAGSSEIGRHAFAGCRRLVHVSIGRGSHERSMLAGCGPLLLECELRVGELPFWLKNVRAVRETLQLWGMPMIRIRCAGFEEDVEPGADEVTEVTWDCATKCEFFRPVSLRVENSGFMNETGEVQQALVRRLDLRGMAEIPRGLQLLLPGLEFVLLPRGITRLPFGFFSGCSALKSVDLEACFALASIGGSSFEDCLSLRVVRLADLIETVHRRAFANSAVERLDLADLTGLLALSLEDCGMLAHLRLPRSAGEVSLDGVVALESIAFGRATWAPSGGKPPMLQVCGRPGIVCFMALDGRLVPSVLGPMISEARVFAEVAGVCGRWTRPALLP